MSNASEMSVMFLGGRLDHTTRMIRTSVIAPDRPAAPIYRVLERHGEPEQRYRLNKVAIPGYAPWWVYFLEGYDPPRGHVLNTNPNR